MIEDKWTYSDELEVGEFLTTTRADKRRSDARRADTISNVDYAAQFLETGKQRGRDIMRGGCQRQCVLGEVIGETGCDTEPAEGEGKERGATAEAHRSCRLHDRLCFF